MKQCIDCNTVTDNFPKGRWPGRICCKCRHQRYKSKKKAYYQEKYITDPIFRDKCQKKGRKTACKARISGKTQKYFESTPRRWLQIKLGRSNTHCKRSNIIMGITLDELCHLWKSQKGLCALTNIPLETKIHSIFSASIDRIDSKLNYTLDNVQLVCVGINLAKNVHSNETIELFIKRIREQPITGKFLVASVIFPMSMFRSVDMLSSVKG